jgi:hypothetical protein
MIYTYRYARRKITAHTYFNVLGERYRKTVDAKHVTRYFKWDGKTWQLFSWAKGRHIEMLVKDGYGKRSKRQPK